MLDSYIYKPVKDVMFFPNLCNLFQIYPSLHLVYSFLLIEFRIENSKLFLYVWQGVQPCTFYLQNGHCKFGSSCKFDHPMGTMRYSPSASSLDMPVAPYPVGSLLGTLASSSSSELRPELVSARMPSSGNPSSSSVGLIFSQSGSVSLADVQLSSQTSVPISNGRGTRQGGEVRRSS